jgi:cobalamin synthase
MLDDSAAFLDDSEADFFDAFLAANRREERLAALMDSDFFLAAFFFDAAIADLLFFVVCVVCCAFVGSFSPVIPTATKSANDTASIINAYFLGRLYLKTR